MHRCLPCLLSPVVKCQYCFVGVCYDHYEHWPSFLRKFGLRYCGMLGRSHTMSMVESRELPL